MKKNRLQIFVFLIFIFAMQKSAILNSEDAAYAFPFAAGFKVPEDKITDIGEFLIIAIPIFLLMFLFGGRFDNIRSGYGKLLIIRDVRRTKLCFKQVLNLYFGFAGCVLIQTLIFLNTRNGETGTVVKMLVLYYLTITAVLMLQGVLELYIDSVYANIAVLIYFTVSILSGDRFMGQNSGMILHSVLFPNLAFGYRNGCIGSGECSIAFLTILVVNILLVGISVKRFRSCDIF